MDIYGEDKCRVMVHSLTQAAKDAVSRSIPEPALLCHIADMLCERKS
jgi:hypothetical protein